MSETTYYVYQITNSINGKIYIGAHKGAVDDGYMGSGKVIKDAVKKYGKESFTKTILCECDSREEMLRQEREMVNAEFVARKDTYNMKLGGIGGFDHIVRDDAWSVMVGAKISAALKGKPNHREGTKHSEETRAKMRKPHIRKSPLTVEQRHRLGNGSRGRQWTEEEHVARQNSGMSGKRHSDATKEKMRLAALARMKRHETEGKPRLPIGFSG